jgi:hypothetical protein
MVWLAGQSTLSVGAAPSIVRARTPCGHRGRRPRWHQAHPVPEPKAIPPTSEPLGQKTGVDLPNAEPRLPVPPISTSVSGGESLLQPFCGCPKRWIRSKFGFASVRTPSWLVVWARGGVHAPACQTWCGAVGPRAAYRSAPSTVSIAVRAGVELSSMVLNLLAVGRGETPLPG